MPPIIRNIICEHNLLCPGNYTQMCVVYFHQRFSEFPTTHMEMEAVADIFDQDGDGYINYKEFIAALRPDRGSSEVSEHSQ